MAAASATSGGTSSPACSARTFWIDISRPFSAWARCSSGRLASIASRPALSFSKIRGTAKNQVGFHLGKELTILRGSGRCHRQPGRHRQVVVGVPLRDVRGGEPGDDLATAVGELDDLVDHRRHHEEVPVRELDTLRRPVVPDV